MPEFAIPSTQRQRLLVFNLRTDADDHILGFTTRWLNELARYYQHMDVLTTHQGRLAISDNVTVYSTGREQGLSRSRQLWRFYRMLWTLTARHRYDACFAHMQPMFATLSAPILQLRGVPIITWYTHRQLNRMVQSAERVSFRVVSAVPSSFPIASPKLRAIGHGIDTAFFTPDERQPSQPPRIVQVARLTAIKHQHVLLNAVRDLDCEVVLIGDIPDGYDDAYKRQLYQQVESLQLTDRVIFAGAQTPEQVRDWYQSATLAVNLSPPGLFDKGALEAMACGLPTIVSNPAFAPLTGTYQSQLHISAPDDDTQLHTQLKAMLALSQAERQIIGADLRAGVVAHHSLDVLIPRLITVMHTGELAQFEVR
ncbi:MAG: glycosyltransferase family 4 protein [Anaerolineae bacterium]